MIAKDRNRTEHDDTDPRAAAGAKAEAQIAFYLKRQFGNASDRDVIVFNDLRVANPDGDDAAQIDHLILYRYGFIVIESKSVSTEVRINHHGEWSRRWQGSWNGMASPILQAKRQVAFLEDLLEHHRSELRRRNATDGKHLSFSDCRFDTIVSISDEGTIDRRGQDLPNVVKAEAVVDRIQAIVLGHGSADSPAHGEARPPIPKFTDDEMKRITDFLKRRHVPLERHRRRLPDERRSPRRRKTSTLRTELQVLAVKVAFAIGVLLVLKATVFNRLLTLASPHPGQRPPTSLGVNRPAP